MQAHAVQGLATTDEHAVGIALGDARPHADERVHPVQAALEHPFVDEHLAMAAAGQHHGDGAKVRREARPGRVMDAGNAAELVVVYFQALLRRDADGGAIQLELHAQLAEGTLNHGIVVRANAGNADGGSCGGGQGDKAAHFDVILTHAVHATFQGLATTALDAQAVGANALHGHAHFFQHAGQLLHMGLAGGVLDDRFAHGHGSGHEGVLRGHHAGLVQEDVGAGEALGRLQHHEIAIEGNGGPQPFKDSQVGVNASPANAVAPRTAEFGATGAGQQRRRQQQAATDASRQFRIRTAGRHNGLDGRPMHGTVPGHLGAQGVQQLQHDFDVQDGRHIVQHHGLLGQQRGGQHGERLVLVALGCNGTGKATAVLDLEVHGRPL